MKKTKEKRLLFALDLDGTYTAAPDLWLEIIKLIQGCGHVVLIATMRTSEELSEIDPRLRELVPQIVPTNRRAKLEYLAAFKIYPDIWIDDMPHFLFQNGAASLPSDEAYEALKAMVK